MTAIVGLVHDGKVYIGGDSNVSYGWVQQRLAAPKVFVLPKAQMIVGVSGDVRIQQIFQYHADIELPEGDAEQTLVQFFIPHFREVVKQHGYEKADNGQSSAGDIAALFGFRERLFRMDGNFAISGYQSSYAAVGSASETAIGALAALSLHTVGRFAPETLIRSVLEICEIHGLYVRPPFVIRNTGELS